MDRLPRARKPIFVDASSSVGLGGARGLDYYLMTHADLAPHIRHCPGWESYPRVQIAWIELLAVFVALYLFGSNTPAHLIVLYSDNTNVVAWLGSRRSPDPTVCALVAAIERIKYQYLLKLSVRYIPSAQNFTADRLSRNCIPPLLYRRGTRRCPCLSSLVRLIHLKNLIPSWANSIAKANSYNLV